MKLVFVLFILLMSAQLFAALPPSLKKDRLQLNIDTLYYQTDSNYDNNGGSFEKITRDRSYTKILIQPHLHYSVSNKIAIWGDFGIGHAQSVNDDFDRTNTNLTDLQLGFQYLVKKKSINITPEIASTIPLYSFDESTDEVIISEGVFAGQGGVWLSKFFGSLNTFLYTGAEYRSGGRSSLFHWNLGADWQINRFSWGGQIRGFTSINDDEDHSDPTLRQAVIEAKNGGSSIHYSVNPEVLEAELWAAWQMQKKINLRFGYGQTLNGKNYAAGQHALVSLQVNFDGSKASSSDQFVPESEEFNEKLFEDVKTID